MMGQICNFDKEVKYACNFGGEIFWKGGTCKARQDQVMIL
jgi:hypothetical protein